MNERIAIIGAGDMGRQIAYMGLKNGYNIIGFFDDYNKGGTGLTAFRYSGSSKISQAEEIAMTVSS